MNIYQKVNSQFMNEKNKVVFLGNSSVGKTSIIRSFYQDAFIQEQAPTIGAFAIQKKIIFNNENEVILSIWDTAGQERYRALAPMYSRGANVIVLVYAINSRDSFDKLQGWIDDLKITTNIMPHLIIVGNKIDLTEERVISFDEGEKFAESVNATFFECSAKKNKGITDLFITAALLVSKVSHESDVEIVQSKTNTNENANQANSTKNCC